MLVGIAMWAEDLEPDQNRLLCLLYPEVYGDQSTSVAEPEAWKEHQLQDTRPGNKHVKEGDARKEQAGEDRDEVVTEGPVLL